MGLERSTGVAIWSIVCVTQISLAFNTWSLLLVGLITHARHYSDGLCVGTDLSGRYSNERVKLTTIGVKAEHRNNVRPSTLPSG